MPDVSFRVNTARTPARSGGPEDVRLGRVPACASQEMFKAWYENVDQKHVD